MGITNAVARHSNLFCLIPGTRELFLHKRSRINKDSNKIRNSGNTSSLSIGCFGGPFTESTICVRLILETIKKRLVLSELFLVEIVRLHGWPYCDDAVTDLRWNNVEMKKNLLHEYQTCLLMPGNVFFHNKYVV